MPSTIRFHRVLRATPERVYRAFLDPEAIALIFTESGIRKLISRTQRIQVARLPRTARIPLPD
jgi:uncharacterized protein YndB with AHSA1/START domain